MSVKIEIAGSTFVAQDKEIGGVHVKLSDLAIAYSGTENGGRVVIAHKTEVPKNYDKELIIINSGEDPIEKDIQFRTLGGEKRIIKAKISAI